MATEMIIETRSKAPTATIPLISSPYKSQHIYVTKLYKFAW